MATFTAYDVVGTKENISDVISNISPTKTPFLSSIGTEKVHNKVFSWQEDALAAVAVNAAIDGADATSATLSATTLRTGYTQILTKTIQVSGTNDAESKYGRSKETAYQMAKASAEVKRDLEHALVGTAQTAVAGDNSTARKLTGAQSQVAAGNIVSTGGVSTAMTEAKLEDALTACWTAGSEPSVIMVTAADAKVIAGFTGASGRYRTIDMKGTTLTNKVDLYISHTGEVAVVANRFMKASDSLVYDPDQFSLAVLRPWTREVLAKTGDSTKQMILGEFGLIHRNQSASAVIRKQA